MKKGPANIYNVCGYILEKKLKLSTIYDLSRIKFVCFWETPHTCFSDKTKMQHMSVPLKMANIFWINLSGNVLIKKNTWNLRKILFYLFWLKHVFSNDFELFSGWLEFFELFFLDSQIVNKSKLIKNFKFEQFLKKLSHFWETFFS